MWGFVYKKHLYVGRESETWRNPRKAQRADHLSLNASNFKPTRDLYKSTPLKTHQSTFVKDAIGT